ncbi:biotin--[acetyl-CoA-carboxylase] ligase [Saltatorellus ferox]|uniref:biotin--[acetyl-CoA-carboxylase] ligase n=1 Tax=Saltatorellus ferox TaxID=2528018 RepID=UPI003AF3570D
MDSTSDRAFDALERGDGRHGDVFIANAQLTGRGTRGRRWASQEGGLYLSVILESPTIPPPGLWTLAGALAAHDAASRFGASVDLDWPNDLVSDRGAKLAGVLAESRGLRPGGTAIFVLGIGMNVMGTVPSESLDRDRPVISLESLGTAVTLEAVELLLLAALEVRVDQALENVASLYDDFYERCVQRGKGVVVDVAQTRVEGRFDGLTADGSLRIFDAAAGSYRRVSMAHVRSLRTATASPEDRGNDQDERRSPE